jgi:hypothetical protein
MNFVHLYTSTVLTISVGTLYIFIGTLPHAVHFTLLHAADVAPIMVKTFLTSVAHALLFYNGTCACPASIVSLFSI